VSVKLKMTPLQWALERLDNCKRIAEGKSGRDLEGWLEDVAYWEAIIAELRKLQN